MLNQLPEIGQLVDVRQRRFVVDEVRPSNLSIDSGSSATPHNLITLSSIEDDGDDETLDIIWELEPGARTIEKVALPALSGFDDPKRLIAFLHAVEWGSTITANNRILHAPYRSGIEIENYQLDPVVRALNMPRVSLLVADDVGLGKTIESGLVMQELILRNRARTVVIVCPSSLQIQWKDQMRDKFGLEFRIVDSDLMKFIRRSRGLQVNPWKHFPRLITSIDFLKRDRPMRLFRETLPGPDDPIYPRRYDLLILDEAHNAAPAGSGAYAVDSLRTEAIRTLVPHFEHKLFLTATPHNGYSESFSALLELLDNQRFHRTVMPDKKQLATIMVRRLKSELPPRWDGTPLFPVRTIKYLEIDYSEREKELHRDLQSYLNLRQKNSREAGEQFALEFVLKLLKKRLFSSPQAFLLTLDKHIETANGQKKQSHTTGKRFIATGILKSRILRLEQDQYEEDEYDAEELSLLGDTCETLPKLTIEENSILNKMRNTADELSRRPDTKALGMINWLKATLKPGGKWNDERVLIFTEYKATQNWLLQLLTTEGLAGSDRLMMLYGGLESDTREVVKAAFQADPKQSPVRILLATDSASEGIDLQNHCHRIIHYEIPWNPNRLEQRNGRLDRHGQRSPTVDVFHFAGRDFDKRRSLSVEKPGDLEGDLEFLMRAVLKIETIREDIGKVGPVIATQVVEAMLGRRTNLNTQKAEQEAQAPRQLLKIERDLRQQLAALFDQLQETKREMHLSPETIRSVVDVGLELAGQLPLIDAKLSGVWPDPSGARGECPVFKLLPLMGSWGRCAEGLEHSHTKIVRPITFDHAVAQGRDDVVLVHLNHRLVQMSMRLLRAELWATEQRRNLHRVSIMSVEDSVIDTVAVVGFGRLVVLGGDNHRLHEEVIFAGGTIRSGRFSRINLTQARQLRDSAQQNVVPESFQHKLQTLWSSIENPLWNALESRVKDKTESLRKTLAEKAESEKGVVRSVLEELQRNISAELNKVPDLQMDLFSTVETDQLNRNRESLAVRLRQIPTEIDRETAIIDDRYKSFTPRMFPMAVIFYVPQKVLRQEGATF